MTTIFTFNGINFKNNGTDTKTANRFYKEVDGKNVRISADAYDEALGLWLKQEQENAKVEEAKKAIESDLAAEKAFNKVEDDHLAEVGKQIAEQAKAKAKKLTKLEPAVLTKNGLVECRDCPIKAECPHHEAMRRNPEEVGGLGLCPRLDIKPKKKAKRKSKDIAYRMIDEATGETKLTLTAKQVDFIQHLPDTYFWDSGVKSALWVDVLVNEIGGQFAGKPMTVGAMISTLREKGLITVGIETINGRKAKIMGLTILGEAVAKVILEVE